MTIKAWEIVPEISESADGFMARMRTVAQREVTADLAHHRDKVMPSDIAVVMLGRSVRAVCNQICKLQGKTFGPRGIHQVRWIDITDGVFSLNCEGPGGEYSLGWCVRE